jgi:rubrerythrin
METDKNLKDAFAGESQANRKYLAFAEKAEADGFPQIAKLFRAVAEAETVHAHSHLKVMDGVKDTTVNLEAAIEGESYEVKEMYPDFLKEAEAEGNKKAARSFKYALEVEKVHFGLFSEALEKLQAGGDLAGAAVWICPVCGNTVIGSVPDKCEVCGVPGDKFVEIN